MAKNCAAGSGFSRQELLSMAESQGDATIMIYCAKQMLLEEVAKTSSDLVKGRHWEEFREAMGGMGCLEASHAEAVRAWEQWILDSEG